MRKGVFGPWTVIAPWGVGEDDELAHDGGYGDLGGFSGFDELLMKRSTVFVEPASDERWHIKGLAKESRECMRGLSMRRIVFARARGLRPVCLRGFQAQTLRSAKRKQILETPGIGEENLERARELRVIEDELFDRGVDLLAFDVDLHEALFVLLFEQGKRDRLGAIFGGGAVFDERGTRCSSFSSAMVWLSKGRGSRPSTSPMRASMAASTRSALTSLPAASAKRRAWRGLTLAIGTPAAPNARSSAR